VKEAHGESACEVGTAVRCGDTIQLQHVATGKNLHSHHFKSPISNNQEVSGFGEDGKGIERNKGISVLCAVTSPVVLFSFLLCMSYTICL
jgi:dolichyl-phosphate-mannose--protein O-mannosyl transferase